MGTLIRVAVAGGDEERARAGVAEAFAAFERVEAVMNEWRPDSPLSALNAAAGSGAWVELPGDLCRVLSLALDGARRTGGLFDPTWAALRDLWRFGDGETGVPPPPAAVAERCPLVDHRALELVPAPGACRARLGRAGMQVGLGGIAKGWAVDEAARRLRARGLGDFLVQAGGDLYAAGRRGGRPWLVGVRDPRGPPERSFAFLAVSDRAFSTSGDYEHFFVAGGRRYHHLIDPRTCRPGRASRAATVLAASAVEAEVLSKAAFLLGGREALRLVEREGAEALLVTARNRVLVSESLRGRLRLGRPTP